MREFASLLPVLLDPRGRCNRKGLLIIAFSMMGVEIIMALAHWWVGVGFNGTAGTLLKLLLCWLAICASSKRLHDLGLGAQWLGWALLATIVWTMLIGFGFAFTVGIEALMPHNPWYLLVTGVAMLPTIGAALWLHLAKGNIGPNRFGPEPEGHGFSAVILSPPIPQTV